MVTPVAGSAALPALSDPAALAAGVGVRLSSSVIPYVTDQLAMAKLFHAAYALMVSLSAATPTVIGVVRWPRCHRPPRPRAWLWSWPGSP